MLRQNSIQKISQNYIYMVNSIQKIIQNYIYMVNSIQNSVQNYSWIQFNKIFTQFENVGIEHGYF